MCRAVGPLARIDSPELTADAMFSALLSALPNLIALLGRLVALFSDNRMITLGERQATARALKRQSEMLAQAKTIDNDVTTIHRRHVDDSAFDTSFERKDDA
jgi:hypothetical protein